MSFYKRGLLLSAFALCSVTAWGKNVCENVISSSDIVNCAERMSPDVLGSEAEINVKKGQVEASGQLLNPELSLQSTTGTLQSERRTETDVSLAFPIEIGGKRSARKQVAQAEFLKSGKELEIKRAEGRKNVILKLNRLRQIYDELALVEESRETFAKLLRQYQGRPALSPEQEVSLTVFRTARGDYNFKKISYEEELGALASFFRVSTGLTLEQVKKALPPKISKWPTLNVTVPEAKASPLSALYEADVAVAQGELDQAKGDAWPTLMVGPSAKFTQEPGGDMQQWGVNLSMPLPVLSLNGGSKAAAAAGVQSAQLKRDQWLEQIAERRLLLEKSYRATVDSLNENPNGHELEQRHVKIESQFMRGLISSALVIEAHRSLVDYAKSRNEHEMKALETYLEIQVIDGQQVELKL
ncbi:MAG: TolC family protein [Bdellovibrio sp.]